MTVARPRFQTPSWNGPTYGAEADQVSVLLSGKPLLEWQRAFADEVLQYDGDTGLLRYRTVVLTVPRQNGKSWLLTVLRIWRATFYADRIGEPQAQLYTSQDRNSARHRLLDVEWPMLDENDNYLVTVRKALGDEQIRFSNGSTIGIVASTTAAGHGSTLDTGTVDEAFHQKDDRLLQAFRPAMLTRQSPQLYIVSTVGLAEDAWFRQQTEIGRLLCQNDRPGTVLYVEYSADEDADPADEETWRGCMPALGATIGIEAVRAMHESDPPALFRRAALNLWPLPNSSSVIPEGVWTACEDPKSRIIGPVFLSVDVAPDRSEATVSAAGLRADGLPHVEVLRTDRGTAWIVPFLRQVAAKNLPHGLVIDSKGAAASLIPELQRHKLDHTVIGLNDVVRAAGAFYDAATAGQLRHIGQASLTTAVYGATKRNIGGSWAFGRTVGVDITPLVSASNALWALIQPPPETPAPYPFSIL